MTNREFSDNFTTLLNSFSSSPEFGKQEAAQDIVLNEYEKSVFLSLAEEDVVKSYFDSTLNSQSQGFDDTPRRQVDYGSLIKVANIQPINYSSNSVSGYETVVNAPIGSSTDASSGTLADSGTSAVAVITGNSPAPEKFYNWTYEQHDTYYVTRTSTVGDCGVEASMLLFDKDGGSQFVPCPNYWGSGYSASYDSNADWITIHVTSAAGRFPFSVGEVVCDTNPGDEDRSAKITVCSFVNNMGETRIREINIIQAGNNNKKHYLSNKLTFKLQDENIPRYLISMSSWESTISDTVYGYRSVKQSNKIYIPFADGKSFSYHYDIGHVSIEKKSDKYYCDTYPTNKTYLKGLFYVDNPSDEIPTFFSPLVKEDGIVISVTENTTGAFRRGCLSIHIENGEDIADYDILIIQDIGVANRFYANGQDIIAYDTGGGTQTMYIGDIREEINTSFQDDVCVLPLYEELPSWVSLNINNNPTNPEMVPVSITCDYNPSATMRHCSIPLFIWRRTGGTRRSEYVSICPDTKRYDIYQAGSEQGTDVRAGYIKSYFPKEIIFDSTINEAELNETKVQTITLELAPKVTRVTPYPDTNRWFDVSRRKPDNTIDVTLVEDNPYETERYGSITIASYDKYSYSSTVVVNIRQLKKVKKVGPLPSLNVNPTSLHFFTEGGIQTYANVNLPLSSETGIPEVDYVQWYGGENPYIEYKDEKVIDWIDIGYLDNGYYIKCKPITDPLVKSRVGSVEFCSRRINATTDTIKQEIVVTQERREGQGIQVPVITVQPLASNNCDGVGFGPDGGEISLTVTVLYADDFSIDGLDSSSFPSEQFSVEKNGNTIKITCGSYAGDLEGSFVLNASNSDASAEPVTVYVMQHYEYAGIPDDYYVVEYEAPKLSLSVFPTTVYLPSIKESFSRTVAVSFVTNQEAGLPQIGDEDLPEWLNCSFNTGHTQLTISAAKNNASSSVRDYWLPIVLTDGNESKGATVHIIQDSYPSFRQHETEMVFPATDAGYKDIQFSFEGANTEYPNILAPFWLKVEYINGILRVSPYDNLGKQREFDVEIAIRNNSWEEVRTTIHVTQLASVESEVITPGNPGNPDTGQDSGDSGADSGGGAGGGSDIDIDDDSVPEGGIFDDRSLLFRLPRRIVNNQPKGGTTDVLFILNEKLIATKGTTTEAFTIRPMSFTEYDRIMSKAYSYPMKRQAWRLFQNQNTGFDIFSEIIPPNGSYNCPGYVYRIRYVRRPKPIILEDLPDGLSIDGYSKETTCELNPILHMDILARAVQMALASRGVRANKEQEDK